MSHTLLYDADCGFCRWALGWILRWDARRRLEPTPIQGPRAAELLSGIDEADRLASWHLVDPAGNVRSGGPAAAPLLRLLPGGRPLGRLAEATPRLVSRAYEWVARHRSALARPLPRSAVRRADAVIEARRRRSPD